MFQSNGSNPRVFMDLSIFDTPPQRLEIELFSHLVPKTANNFRALCTGEAGVGQTTGKPLHYKGSFFHSFYHSFGAEGGDFENNNGTGGESIYGGTFKPELYPGGRSGPGVLMTVNQRGTNVIGSLFFMCYDHSPFLDGCSNVVFGKVVKGMETVIQLGKMGFARVQITDCGEVSGKPQSNSGVPVWIPTADKYVRVNTSKDSISDVQNPSLRNQCEKPISEVENNIEKDSDRELEIRKLRFQLDIISSILGSQSIAKISELKQIAEEFGNNRLVSYEKPSSYLHQHSDNTSKCSIKGVRIPSLRNRSDKSGNNIMTHSDKELEIEILRFKHAVMKSVLESN